MIFLLENNLVYQSWLVYFWRSTFLTQAPLCSVYVSTAAAFFFCSTAHYSFVCLIFVVWCTVYLFHLQYTPVCSEALFIHIIFFCLSCVCSSSVIFAKMSNSKQQKKEPEKKLLQYNEYFYLFFIKSFCWFFLCSLSLSLQDSRANNSFQRWKV